MVKTDKVASPKFTQPVRQKTVKPQSNLHGAGTMQNMGADTFNPTTTVFGGIPNIPSLPPTGRVNTLDYDGVTIDISNLGEHRLHQLKTALDALQNDPDGQKLMAFAKAHNQIIEFNPKLYHGALAANTGTKYKMILGPQTFRNIGPDGKPGLIASIAHEMVDEVHASEGQHNGDTVTGDAFSTLIGRRIAHRYYNEPWSVQDEQKYYQGYVTSVHNSHPHSIMGDPKEISAYLFKTTGISIDPSVFAISDLFKT